MAYYDAFITKWGTLTPGTTVAKLAQLNAATVTGAVPTSFTVTGAQLLNCINWTEFTALTAQQQSNLLNLCAIPGSLLGGSSNVSFVVDGMFMSSFTNMSGPTMVALTALAQSQITPWWKANGYQRQFDMGDVTAAGVS